LRKKRTRDALKLMPARRQIVIVDGLPAGRKGYDLLSHNLGIPASDVILTLRQNAQQSLSGVRGAFQSG
jgi:hypothetical protein